MKLFSRDVFVNIVGNLTAAAIIYLFGIAVGWFKKNDTATGLAVAFLSFVVATFAILLMFLDNSIVEDWIGFFFGIIGCGVGLGMLVLSFSQPRASNSGTALLVFGSLFTFYGLLATAGWIVTLLERRRLRE